MKNMHKRNERRTEKYINGTANDSPVTETANRRAARVRKAGFAMLFIILLISILAGFGFFRPVNNGFTGEAPDSSVADRIQAEADAATMLSEFNAKVNASSTANPQTFTLTEDWNTTDYLNVPSGKSLILDLNGHTINRGLTAPRSDGFVFYVPGTLVINDSSGNDSGKITGGYDSRSSGAAGAIYLPPNGTLTINGGTITGNRGNGTYAAGAVYMYGTRSSASASFTMTGGKIIGNTATGTHSVGGVFHDDNNGYFVMTGGEISGNTGDYYGGLIIWDTEKRAEFGGSARILNNTTSSGTVMNLSFYRPESCKIEVCEPFTSNAHIGVTRRTNGTGNPIAGIFTIGYSEHNGDYNYQAVKGFVADPDFCFLMPSDDSDESREEVWLYSKKQGPNWDLVCSRSVSLKTQQKYTMIDDWTAEGDTFGSQSYSFSGGLYVPANANVILDLNGYTLDRARTSSKKYGSVIGVAPGANTFLTIEDSSSEKSGLITGGYDYTDGKNGHDGLPYEPAGGIQVYQEATLYLNGGTIAGNRATGRWATGGIMLRYYSNLYMTGGVVRDNVASGLGSPTNGGGCGGVFVDGSSIFSMLGGTITDNSSECFGGIVVWTNSIMYMGGGAQLYGNTAGGVPHNSWFRIDPYMTHITHDITDEFRLEMIYEHNNFTTPNGTVITEGWGEHCDGRKAEDHIFSNDTKYGIIETTTEDGKKEAALWCYDNEKNWQDCVTQSAAEKGYANDIVQTFILYSDWLAPANGSYVTAFGTTSGYVYGALYASSATNILFDLNGHTIDRGLAGESSSGTERCVLRIDGKLRIIDSSDEYDGAGNLVKKGTGKMTGGYSSNASYGSCLMIYNTSAICTVEGGTITGNITANTAAITVHSGSKLNLGGSVQIYGNPNGSGGEYNLQLQATSGDKSLIGISSRLTAIHNTSASVESGFKVGNKIPVSRATIGLFTNGFGEAHPNEEPKDYFSCDDSSLRIQDLDKCVTKEGYLYSVSPEINWEYAVNTSKQTGKPEIFVLEQDWTAEPVGSYGTTFSKTKNTTSFDGAFYYGALGVAQNAQVILDLNGHVLDRALSSAPSSNGGGGVIQMRNSNLWIHDSSDYDANGELDRNPESPTYGFPLGNYVGGGKGKITGGYGNNGGAIDLDYTCQLYITGGEITGNTGTQWAAAILADNSGAHVIMTGGSIHDNYQIGSNSKYYFGGGVHVYYPAQLSLGGRARIYDNYNNRGEEQNVSFDNPSHNALNSTYCITIVEKIFPEESAPGKNDGFWVGVTRDTNNYTQTDGNVFTTGLGQFLASNYKTSDAFFADNPLYVIQQTGSSFRREATVYSHDNQKNWQDCVTQSAAEKGYANDIVQTFILYSDWLAPANGSYATAFGTTSGYVYGALYASSATNILFDLNGHTIDRGLAGESSSGTERCVLRIDGKLRIIDSSDEYDGAGNLVKKGTGKMTGGYSTNALYGSGLMIYNTSAICTVEGGTITGNVTKNTAAVTVHSGSKLKLGGSALIYDNPNGAGGDDGIQLQATTGTNAIIEIVSRLQGVENAGRKIPVRRAANGFFTEGFEAHHNYSASASDYFVKGDDLYNIINEETEEGKIEGYFLSTDNGVNWEYAVNTSMRNRDWEIFQLSKDWIAEAHSRYTTSFSPNAGTSESSPYWYGCLMVPVGAKVVLDLNGHTLDRKLADTSYSSDAGLVLRVFGELIIIDSSMYSGGEAKLERYTNGEGKVKLRPAASAIANGTGVITGGRSRNAGGIQMYRNGDTIMYGGTITGNVGVTWAGGVIVEGTSQFTMLGGEISNNNQIGNDSRFSGGIHVYHNSNRLYMGGNARVLDNVSYGVNKNVNFYNVGEKIKMVSEAVAGTDQVKGFYVGITMDTNNYTSPDGTAFTEGWEDYNTAGGSVKAPEDFFFSDLNWGIVKTPVGDKTEAGIYSHDNEKNWREACVYSRNNGSVQVYFRLYSNWTAYPFASYYTAFGYDGSSSYAYCRGSLYVSPTTNIVLDLAGFKLDRALEANGGAEYTVIRVDGELKIVDSSDEYDSAGNFVKKGTGVITGGYSTDMRYGSGIMIYRKSASAPAICTITGGTITGSKGAPGITVYSISKLNLGGTVSVYNNTNADGTKQSNIDLQSEEMKIGIVSELLNSSPKMGVTRLGGGQLTEGYGANGNTQNADTFFESENANYGVVNDATEAGEREAFLLSYDSATSWEYAIRMSLKYGGKPYVCKLYHNWSADLHSSYGTSFGAGTSTTSGYYYYGSLLVPRGANVILDLNGCTVDRGLAGENGINKVASGGYVFYLTGGLQIIDTAVTQTDGSKKYAGKITGGWNTTAGIAYVTGASGSLSVSDVEITGNKGNNGIYIASGSKLALGGNVRIHDNTDANGNERNIYLAGASDVIQIESEFASTANVGVTLTTNNFTLPNGRTFTRGWSDFNSTADGVKNPADYFYSDYAPDYEIRSYTDPETGATEGVVWCLNNQKNWQDACERSQATGTMQDFVLYSDWTAGANGSYYTAFGTASTAYIRGSLFVNTNTKIRLDLNGHTLNRALTENGGIEYSVLRCDGELIIFDSSDEYDETTGALTKKGTGLITGGYSTATYYGGAMLIYNARVQAKCTILGGTITGNKGTDVGGVSVSPLSKLCLGGSVQIYGNTATNDTGKPDIYLQKADSVIDIVSPLACVTGEDEAHKLGVWRAGNGAITSGFEAQMGASANAEKLFYSQNLDYRVTNEKIAEKNEAVLLSNDHAINWLYTVKQSLNDNGNEKTFVLYNDNNDWTAASHRSYGTAFGTDGTAYYMGALLVPEGASVLIDLNGNSINRNNTGRIVIYVMGTLRITDSKNGANAAIRGGSDGVYVYGGGTCILESGNITGNAGTGINVQDGAFTQTGGKVTGNGAGVSVSAEGRISLGGTAYVSGGDAGKNLQLAPDVRVEILEKQPFTDGAKISFVRDSIGQLTTGWGKASAENPAKYFESEDSRYVLTKEEVDGVDEAVLISYDNEINWHYAVTTSQKTHAPYKLRLYPENYDGTTGGDGVWRAKENATYGTAFGTLSSFLSGGLYVPADAEIILDLHGVDVNRNLENARANGYVFFVDGKLTIVDESTGKHGAVTGGKNTSAGSAGGIHIGATGSVILEGVTVSGNQSGTATSSAGGVYVGGSLEVKSGTLVTENEGQQAGGVLVANTGSVTMTGGEIKENTARGEGAGGVYTAGSFLFKDGGISANGGLAGGVYVGNRGTFTMQDGAEISNNTGTTVGGVFVYGSSLSVFELKGGKVTGNKADQSGGLYVVGTANVEGGEISGNTASGADSSDGGGSGVYVSNTGTLNLSGGKIAGNYGKNGLRVYNSGVLNVSGNPVVTGNVLSETDDAVCNVYFNASDRYINVVGELKADAKIGVTRDGAGVFTRGYGTHNSAHPNTVFTSDNTDYAVSVTKVSETDEAAIGTPVPVPTAIADLVYDKTEQILLSGYDEKTMTYATETLPEGVTVDSDGNFRAQNAGTYLITFTPKTGYCWQDGGDAAGTTFPFTVTATIAKKPVTIVWQQPEAGRDYVEFTYDGKEHAPTATLQGICEGDECDILTISGGQTNASADGTTYTANVYMLSNENYTVPSDENNECKFVILRADLKGEGLELDPAEGQYKKPVRLSVSGLPTDDRYTITYEVTAGSGAGYISDETGKPDPNGGYFTGTQTGAVTITAKIAPDTNYNDFSADFEFTVNKADIELGLSKTETVYGDDLLLEGVAKLGDGSLETALGAVTYTVAEGSDVAEIQDGNKLVSKKIGKVKVTVKAEGNANLNGKEATIEITVLPRPLKFVWDPDTLAFAFDGKEKKPAVQRVEGLNGGLGLVNGDTLESLGITVSGGQSVAGKYNDEGESKDAAWISALANENYDLENSEDVRCAFEIKKAAFEGIQIVTKPDAVYREKYPIKLVYADGTTEYKGDPNAKRTYSVENLGGTATIGGDGVLDPTHVGKVKVTVTIESTDNYEGGTVTAELEIVPASMKLTLAEGKFVYGDETDVKALVGGYFETNDAGDKIESEVGTLSFAVKTIEGETGAATLVTGKDGVLRSDHVGKIIIVVSATATTNYAATEAEFEITVSPRPVTIAWQKPEGKETPEFTYDGQYHVPVADSFANVLAGDTVAIAENGITVKDQSVNAGNYTATVTKLTDPNYTVEGDNASVAFVIKPKPVSLEWTEPETGIVYNGEDQAPKATVKADCLVKNRADNGKDDEPFAITVLGTKNAGSNLKAVAIGTEDPNYTVEGGDNLECLFTILPKPVRVVWTNTSLVYTGGMQTPTATVNPEDLIAGDECTVTSISGGQTLAGGYVKNEDGTLSPNGDYRAVAYALSNGNYTVVYGEDGYPTADYGVDFLIAKADPTLSFSIPYAVYGTDVVLTVSGNPETTAATYTPSGANFENYAKLNGNVLTPIDVGVITFVVNVPETDNYNAATKLVELEIKPRPVVLAWEEATFTYNGKEQAPKATVSNLVEGDSAPYVTVKGGKNAGDHTAVAVSVASRKYTVTGGENLEKEFTIAPLAVELSWSNLTLEYNGKEQAPTARVLNLAEGDSCEVTAIGAKDAGVNLTATADKLGNDNYTLTGGSNLSTRFTITPYVITVVWGETQLPYTGEEQAPEARAEKLFEGDVCSVFVDGGQTDVGEYTATAVGVSNPNYRLGDDPITTDFSIVKASMPLTLGELSFVYGTAVSLEVGGNPESGVAVWSLTEGTATANLSGTTLTPTKIGTLTLTVTVRETANYSETTKSFEVTVSPRPVTLNWSDLSFTYNGEPHLPKASVSNLVSGDECDVTVTGERTDAGVYTATAEALSNENYTLTDGENITAAFVIERADVTATIKETTVRYGETLTLAVNTNIDIGSAEVTFALVENGGYEDYAVISGNVLIPVKVGKVRVIATIAETNNTSGATAEAEITILKGILPLEFRELDLVYGGSFTLDVSGNLENAAVSFAIANGTGAAKQVEGNEYIATQAGTVTITATVPESDYYEKAELTLNAEIKKLPVEIEWTYYDFTYDGIVHTPTATVVNRVSWDGVLDTVNVTVSGTKNAGTRNEATVIAVDNSNYTVDNATNGKTLYTIAPRKVNRVEWEEQREFPYNGQPQAPKAYIPSEFLVAGDDCTVEVSGAQTNIGSYTAIAVGTQGEDKGNYVLDNVQNPSVSFTIVIAELNLSFKTTEAKFGEDLLLELIGNVGNGDVTYTIERIEYEDGTTDEGDAELKDGEYLVPKHVGKVKVTAKVAETMNTHAGEVTAVFTISKGALSLDFEKKEVVYGDTLTFGLLGNAEAGGVTYEIVNGAEGSKGAARLSDDKLSLIAEHVGYVTVIVRVEETDSYAAATKEIVVQITPRAARFEWTNFEFTYDKTEKKPTAHLSNAVSGDESVTVEVKGKIDAGNDLVATAILVNNENYYIEDGELSNETKFTIKPRTIRLEWEPDDFTYNGEEQVRKAQALGLCEGDSCAVTVSEGFTDAGDYQVTATGVDNLNYRLPANNLTVDFTIKKAELQLSFGKKSTGFGAGFEIELNGNLGGGAVTYTSADESIAKIGGEGNDFFVPVAIGNVKIKASVAESNNYKAGSIEETFTITKGEPHIELVSDTAIYGDNLPLVVSGNDGNGAVTYRIVGGSNGGRGVLSDSDNALFIPLHVGKILLEITVAGSGNFEGCVVTAELTVKPRPVTDLNWSTVELTYNGKAQSPTATIETVNGDVCEVIVAGAEINAGNYSATATGLKNENYELVNSDKLIVRYEIGKMEIDVELVTERVSLGSAGEALLLRITNRKTGEEVAQYNSQTGAVIPNTTYKDIWNGAVDGEWDQTISFTITNGTGAAKLAGDKRDPVLVPERIGTVAVSVRVPEIRNFLSDSTMALVVIEKAKAPVDLKTKEVEYGSSLKLEITGLGEDLSAFANKISFSLSNGSGAGTLKGSGANVTLETTRAGEVFVTINVAETEQFGANSVTVPVTIQPKVVEIEWEDPELVYDGTEKKPIAKVKADSLVNANDKVEVEVQGAIEAGKHIATAVSVSNPNYTVATPKPTHEFEIKKAKLDLNFTSTIATVDEPMQLEVTGNVSGNPVQYSLKYGSDGTLLGTGDATIEGDILHPLMLGTVTVIATVAESANYEACTIEKVFTIAKPQAPVELVKDSVLYGDTLTIEVINTSEDEIGEVTYRLKDGSEAYALLEGDLLKGLKAGKAILVVHVEETLFYRETDLEFEIEILPRPVKVTWEVGEYVYDGTEHKPVAKVDESCLVEGDDPFEIGVQGAVNAGTHTATAIWLDDPNYTVENGENLTVEFTIAPRKVELVWTTPEEGFTYNGKPQAPEAAVKPESLIAGDEVTVTVAGGVNAGSHTAIASALDNENYTLEGCENAKQAYTIAQAEVEVEWSNLDLEYNGKTQSPTATVKTEGLFGQNGVDDVCTVIGISGGARDAGVHTATATTLSNPNYKLAEGKDHSTPYTVLPREVVLSWGNLRLEYTGKEQLPVGAIVNVAENDDGEKDDVALVVSNGATAVGGYYAGLSLTGAHADNYKISPAANTQYYTIVPKAVTVKVTSLNKNVPHTGRPVTLGDPWYTLTAEGLSDADAAKDLGEVFDLGAFALSPLFIDGEGNRVTSVSAIGIYPIVPTVRSGAISGNDNYTVTVVIDESYGKLTIAGSEVLQLTEDSKYQFVTEQKVLVSGYPYWYRRAYGELNWIHGADDTELDRVSLGQIAPNTTIKEWLSNIVDPENVQLFTRSGTLVFDGADSENYDDSAIVGTGWYAVYAKSDTVYLSVLGDLTGDGKITEDDSEALYLYITGQRSDSRVELLLTPEGKLAAFIVNNGQISAADLSRLNWIIVSGGSLDQYYYSPNS